MKLIPLYIRMWLFFLLQRTDILTEKDLTKREITLLKEYLITKSNRNMYLSFGTIRVNNLGEVIDLYSFARVEGKGLVNWLNNLSYKYQIKNNYKGYAVKIKLI